MTDTMQVTPATETSIVKLQTPELEALPLSKAEQIRAVFIPMADQIQAFEDDFNKVMEEAAEEVTPALSKRARRLRLDIAQVRIQAENARKAVKAEYLAATQAIDGVARVLKWGISQKEESLEAIEKHAERMEEERRAALHAERVEALAPYMEAVPERDFSLMEEDVFAAYLDAQKRDHADRMEAERVAEAARVAEAEANARFIARQALVAPVFDFFPKDLDLGTLPEGEFQGWLQDATEKKQTRDMEQEAVRREAARLAAENARIKAEADAAEAARKAEREEAERAERERVEAEAKANREREAAERAEAARRTAEAAEAAAAPVRARLGAWVDSFALPELPGEDHAVAEKIRAKFDEYQAWARRQVEAAGS